MKFIVSIFLILPFIIKLSLQIDERCRESLNLRLELDSYEKFKTVSYPQFTSFTSIRVTFADLTWMPDFMFGNYCIKTLDFSNNKIENVSENALSSIYALDRLFLNNNNLKSLTNLINSIDSSNITYLNLENNNLAYIDTQLPTSLTYIIMNNNFLTSIEEFSFQNLSKLEKLYLQRNQISKIPNSAFFGLYSLKFLDFSFNMIESIETSLFCNTKKLIDLNMYSNRIKWIEPDAFVNLVNLKNLILGNNKIKLIDKKVLNGVNGLNSLNLNYNEIEIITTDSLLSLKNLETLYISQMKIKKIESGAFDSFVKLNTLISSFNQLPELNKDLFKKMDNLQRLYIQNNVLAKIESNTFRGLINLTYLKLENNLLKNIESDTFTNLTKLDQLFLRGNLIKNIPSNSFVNLTKLTELYLNSNLIDSIGEDAFINLTILDTLDLSNNKLRVIKRFYFKSLGSLITLKLNQNSISLIETSSFQSLTKAQSIDLSDNFIINIESGAFRGVNLKLSILKKNKLEEISENFFTGSSIEQINMDNIGLTSLKNCSMSTLTNVTEMSLGFNKLTLISNNLFCMSNSESFSKLLVLNLNNNRIKSLDFLSEQFSNLLTLNLEWNLIEYLELAEFKGLKKLESLNINNNRLISIEAGFFKRLDLKNIYASNIALESWRHLDLDEFSANVQTIDLSFNNFDSINLNSTLYKMRSLLIRRINITSIQSINTAFISNLNSLDLSENSIQDLTMFKWFQLKKLTSLSLTRLNITNLDSLLLFSDQYSIQILNLSFNSISSVGKVISQFSFLIALDLSNNQIEYISNDLLNILISKLYLQNNKLRFFPYVNNFCKLLDLSNNLIRRIDIYLTQKLNSLYFLGLSRNQIDTIQFDNIFGPSNELKELCINENQLVEITSNDLSYFKMLQILDLSSNRINLVDERAFNNMDQLSILNLADNNLTEFKSNTFINQLQLSLLNLSHNRLEIITKELFSSLYNLKKIDLNQNLLRFIEDYSFKSATLLESIVLDSNPMLVFSTNTFYGLDSIKIISIGFHVLRKSSNKPSLLNTLSPVMIKKVVDQLYFRSISLIYSDETTIDCELVLEFSKMMIQVNLRTDYDFVLFDKHCYDIKLI